VIATIVDWEALLQVVVASLVAGIGATVAFSLAILGATRFADMRRDERVAAAWGYGALAFAGLAATLAAVLFGIYVMTAK
jgi:hypothetical protein